MASTTIDGGKRKAVVVGISGASSSGKTTLARLLRDVFPGTFILHEDDFYKPEAEIPEKDGELDWDCPEALCVPDMIRALSHIRESGTFPPFVDSKEDQNSIGACPVSEAKIAAMKAKVQAWLEPGQPGHAILPSPQLPSSSATKEEEEKGSPLRICLLDGFLLYAAPTTVLGSSVAPLLDVRLFLRVSRERATARRSARDGYATLEGFWKDPPGYVDRIVWPNYVASHAWLFERGDVESGALDPRVLADHGIHALPPSAEVDVDMETTFEWAVDTLMRELESRAGLR